MRYHLYVSAHASQMTAVSRATYGSCSELCRCRHGVSVALLLALATRELNGDSLPHGPLTFNENLSSVSGKTCAETSLYNTLSKTDQMRTLGRQLNESLPNYNVAVHRD
ncbi:hypothetical protein J6590_012829 [Homalodisca vitripennis]|nr:hypothetical protein J6590_012829 [Homalodisca vitripennis]